MKITNIDSFIEEFRNGRDIWSRTTVELAVREIERLRKENNKLKVRLAASENDLVLFEVSEMLKKTQARVQELEQERRWIPVGERLPETRQKVEVCFRGQYDKKLRTTIATYIKARTVMACDFMDEETPEEAMDYDKTIDDYWAIEGFWETMWTSGSSYCIEDEVLFWRKRPQPPSEGE